MSLARCVLGSLATALRPESETVEEEPLSVLTFSVVPELTSLWLSSVLNTLEGHSVRLVVGDCSGALHRHFDSSELPVDIVPTLNFHHGQKLDTFIKKHCRSKNLLISDDDIFWRDDSPLNWGLSQFESDPGTLAAGLLPKHWLPSILEGKVDRAMGSIILLRRAPWLGEKLSFQVVPVVAGIQRGDYFDTGEHAQWKLTTRGYNVALGTSEIASSLIEFAAMSTWTLKIRTTRGDLERVIGGIPIKAFKAWRVIRSLRGIDRIRAEVLEDSSYQPILPERYLVRAEECCFPVLEEEEISHIRQAVDGDLARLHDLIAAQHFLPGLRSRTKGRSMAVRWGNLHE